MKKSNATGKIITFIFSLIIFTAVILIPFYSYAASNEAKLSGKFREELRKQELSETIVSVEPEEVPHAVTDHNAKLPFVVKTVPADSDTNISINAQIIIMFNKPMDYLSVNRSSITVMDEVGSVIEGNISYDSASYTATFSPRTMFSKNTLYSIFIPSYLVRDAEGNSLDRNMTISFRTESRSDTTRIYENRKAPRAVKSSPEDNAVDVPLDSYVMVDFSLPLAGSKVDDSTITINDGAKNIDGKTVYIEKERQILFVPGKNLEHGKVYRVTVNSMNIESLEGFKLAENHSWTFSTKKPLDEVPPEVIATSPIDGAYEVSEQARISASFSEDVEPTTFNKYTVILSDGSQDVPGKITYDKRTQKVAFIPLEKLRQGQKYNMLISNGVKDLAGNPMNAPKEWTFTTKKPVVMEKPRIIKTYPVDNEKMVKIDSKLFVYFNKVMNEGTCNVFNIKLTNGARSLPISTSFVRNGSFVTIIPLENLEYSTLYKVQLSSRITDSEQQILGSDFQFSFTTMEKPDTAQPEIVTVTPQDGALNIALNSIISVRVSEPIIKSSISQDCITVKNDRGVNITGSIQYEDAEKLLTFIPESRFDYLTKYIVSVKDGLRDRAGNRLKNSMTWSFTTPQAPDGTAPRVISWLPKTGEQMIAVSSIIQIIFSERVKEDTVNGKNIQLYDDSGTEVNTAVTYDVIMKRATITPRRNLEFGMPYKIVVSKLITDLAGNTMKETFLSHFKTVPAPDKTRPELSSTKPESGAINVPLNTEIFATFTKKLDPLTVTGKNIFLRNENDRSDVACEISYNEKTKQINIVPKDKFKYSTTYQLIISRGVTDLAGNLFDSTIVIEFTTLEEPDITAPEIKRVSPLDNAKDIPVDSAITAWFTKKIKDSTITERNISLFALESSNSADIFCKIAYEERDIKVVITPITKLKYASKYKVVIKNLTDNSGNQMKASHSFTFETESEPDHDPPTVINSHPKNNAKGVSDKADIYVKFSEQIEPATISSDTIKLSYNKKPVEFDAIYQPESCAVLLKPSKPLEFDKLYTVEIAPDITDLSGNKLGVSHVFQFKTLEIPDLEKPKVTTVNPSNGSSEVSKHIQIQAVFSKKLKTATVNKYTFFVSNDATEEQVSGKVIYDTAKSSVTFMPSEEFKEGLAYRATLTEGITDLAGNPLEKGISWAFTVGSPRDSSKLDLVTCYPKSNELNVPSDMEVALTFNKAINEGTANEYTILVSDGNKKISGDISFDSTGKKIVWKPKSKLKKAVTYSVTITNGLEDDDGQCLSKKVKFSFTTK